MGGIKAGVAMAEAEESAATTTTTETKKFINPRVEIDTAPPFESVKEAVDHFGGGGGPWIPHHMLRLAANHNDSELITLYKVEEQTSQLEKDLISKKQETLQILHELEAAKRFVQDLKLNLMQEMSKFMSESSDMNPEARRALRWCPATSSGSISMELNQAKIDLGKTTTNLAAIQAAVEALNRKVKDEHKLFEKITERKAMDFYCSKMNVLNDDQEPNFEAEQFKNMTEASKYEVTKAMSEIERTKTSIKMAEMRLIAARKIEEAAKAVEAIALAEKFTESTGISSCKSHGITLSLQEYNALTHKAQQGEDSCSITKKLNDTRRREEQNASKFRFKNSRVLQTLDEENESNLELEQGYRSKVSIGDTLGRKLILEDDDIVVGKHMERHGEREQSGLILHPPRNGMEQRTSAEKQYYRLRKKFGFIHISIPRQTKKKNHV